MDTKREGESCDSTQTTHAGVELGHVEEDKNARNTAKHDDPNDWGDVEKPNWTLGRDPFDAKTW